MKLLLDTHTFLWISLDDPQLSEAAREGGVTFFLYFQLFDIAALRFVSLRTKGKAAMLAVA